MLDQLFSSRTRVKLLSQFMLNSETDYYVRELTRLTNEQINSVRRELENLKRIGLLKSKLNNNKKYYSVNEYFPILEELKSIFSKFSNSSKDIVDSILLFGNIDLITISGKLTRRNDNSIDILVVGNLDNNKLKRYLEKDEERRGHEISFVVFDKKDFIFRLKCNDRFLDSYFKKKYVIIYDKLKLKKYL